MSNRKLSEDDVYNIRVAYSLGNASYQDLAQKYGVKNGTIGAIVRGKIWTHVGGPVRTDSKSQSYKLDEDKVFEIRELFANNDITLAELAKRYNVTREAIRQAVSGVTWQKVGGPILEENGHKHERFARQK